MLTAFPSEGEKRILANVQFRHQDTEVVQYLFTIKYVMPGRHRRMCRKYRIRRYGFNRSIKLQTADDQFTRPFNDLKRCVSFIDMPDSWAESGSTQGPHATDTQYDFLLQPESAVTTIELAGDLPVAGLILCKIRVE